jgi:hypothetical protein
MEKVFNRKKELIKRDPAYKEALTTSKQIAGTREDWAFEDIPYIGTHMRKYGYPEEAVRSREIQHEKEHPDAWKLFRQLAGVQHKWQVLLRPDFRAKEISIVVPYTNPEVIWTGTPPLITGHEGVVKTDSELYPQLYWSPYPNPFNKPPILFDINDIYRMSEKWIPILVNVSRLNKSDARTIKQQIWAVINNNLGKGGTKKPHDEFKECTFLYHLRGEKTFQNYLRWYDLNVGSNDQAPNGYSFRAIALLNNVWHKDPEFYEDAKKQIANRTKIVRSTRGERVLKGVVGKPIKGEDMVEKAVKLIYNAIHRRPYPSKKSKQKKYNCPAHGVSCPKHCSYLKTFMKDFDRRHMLFKPLYTTDPAVLAQVAGKARSHSKRKPTADQQSNTK